MRRGLMGWDAEELPVGVLDDRARRLRAAMQRGGVDALFIYTNLVRPSAVSYLTGFTPYWSEGILLVGRAGPPTFATALSKRVANWIRSVSPVGEIVNTPQPGKVLGERLAADPAVQRVGVLEIDAFPSGSYDDLVAAAPGSGCLRAPTRLRWRPWIRWVPTTRPTPGQSPGRWKNTRVSTVPRRPISRWHPTSSPIGA